MNIDIKLNKGAFEWWQRDNEIYVKGYAYDANNKFLKDQVLLDYFHSIKENVSINKLSDILYSLNGCFSVIIKNKEGVFLAVDRLRSMPLFYKLSKNLFLITDKIKIESSSISKESSEYYEFLLSGCTVNDSTLLKQFKQVESSSIVFFSNNKIKKTQYFKHLHKDFFDVSYKNFFKDLRTITDNFMERLVNSAKDRTIVVPLSGGYDSRYILTGLKRLNCTNVICYTYGKKGSYETVNSSNVAKKLGYKIYKIEYTSKKWEILFKSKKFCEYIDYSFNYSSLPHIQDFIALEELTSNKLIPLGSIIVPGYCGDFLGGSLASKIKLIKPYNYNDINVLIDAICNYILTNKYNNIKLDMPLKINLINKIRKKIIENTFNNEEEFMHLHETFIVGERLAKFIINSLRLYEFYGFEWRIPLWDNELIEYWYRVPYELRINNYLYNKFLFNDLFNPYGVGYKKSIITSSKKVLLLKKLLPSFIYDILRNKLSNVNNFSYIRTQIIKDFKEHNFFDIKENDFNGLFAFWILNIFLNDKSKR